MSLSSAPSEAPSGIAASLRRCASLLCRRCSMRGRAGGSTSPYLPSSALSPSLAPGSPVPSLALAFAATLFAALAAAAASKPRSLSAAAAALCSRACRPLSALSAVAAPGTTFGFAAVGFFYFDTSSSPKVASISVPTSGIVSNWVSGTGLAFDLDLVFALTLLGFSSG